MISMDEYKARRQRLLQQVGPGNGVIVFANNEVTRNGDNVYPFRQNSDFYYLTGFNEPDAVLVLTPDQEYEVTLFNRPRDLEQEQWTGPRVGQEGACKVLGMDAAYPIDEFPNQVQNILGQCKKVYYAMGKVKAHDQLLLASYDSLRKFQRRGKGMPDQFINLDSLLHEMRLFKSLEEQRIMRQVASISAAAHCVAMQQTRVGGNEYQVAAAIKHHYFVAGCQEVAYQPIVASGANATILHYVENRRQLQDGELLLIDSGAELDNYAADITRTFPINGRFSGEQKAIYELVLEAQLQAINLIKPGTKWNSLQNEIVKIITQGLVDLGILRGNVEQLIATEAYKKVYMHGSGHWLGLDVHDVGDYKINNEWRELEPGMVLTVEPGIYIGATEKSIDEKWHHIGVRIEDDVLVTATGCEVLSKEAPKQISDIEALMND